MTASTATTTTKRQNVYQVSRPRASIIRTLWQTGNLLVFVLFVVGVVAIAVVIGSVNVDVATFLFWILVVAVIAVNCPGYCRGCRRRRTAATTTMATTTTTTVIGYNWMCRLCCCSCYLCCCCYSLLRCCLTATTAATTNNCCCCCFCCCCC